MQQREVSGTVIGAACPADAALSKEAGGERMAIWFAVTADRRPGQLWRRVAALAAPEFQVTTIRESARLGTSDGAYRAHWYCVVEPLTGGLVQDEFAALRFLKRMIGAGFRVLRFDTQEPPELA